MEILTPEKWTLLLPFRDGAVSALRVGVVVDGDGAPPWADSLAALLGQIPGIEVQRLIVNSPARDGGLGWLAGRLYQASRSRFDPFGEYRGEGAPPSGDSIEAIRKAGCDLVFWLASSVAADASGLARYGVVSFEFGGGGQNRGIPYWEDVAGDATTSQVKLCWQGRHLRTAETATIHGPFVTKNAFAPVVAAIRLAAGVCIEVSRHGGEWLSQRAGRVEPIERAPVETPSNFEVAGFLTSKVLRSARLRLASGGGKEPRWFFALRPNRGGESMSADPANPFRALPLPAGVAEMADPFLWTHEGREYLLFEEVAAGQSRGRLAVAELTAEGRCGEMQILMDRPFHLSYPCPIEAGGELFLLPETSAAKRVELHRFRKFPGELEPVAAPLEGVALKDTTPICLDGVWYFFSTTGEPFAETVLFVADRLDGPWRLHPASPVSTSVRNSRSAGQLFWKHGRLFRPTQDCSVRYGWAMNLNEVVKLTPSEFEERVAVRRLLPDWEPGLWGTHTWNESERWQVVDALRF